MGGGVLDGVDEGEQAGDQGEGAGDVEGRGREGRCRGAGDGARVRTAATMPTGTLTKKTARQSKTVVRMPPNSTPAAMPMLPMVPHMASAVARCRAGVGGHDDGQGRGGEHGGAGALGAAGHDQGAAEEAWPETREPMVKTASPVRNIGRRSKRSASRPPSSRNPPLSST